MGTDHRSVSQRESASARYRLLELAIRADVVLYGGFLSFGLFNGQSLSKPEYVEQSLQYAMMAAWRLVLRPRAI